ncbi:MAG: tripartite tricarboxylate transporter substrate binding protein [Burkholderiales bacterium]|nr:tripartite tricarboxylate transporter substrate binding protein [Burkholderiales bacterium]
MRTILRFAFLAAFAFTLAPPAALAQAYPTKPVRLMIPWPAGGSTDIVGRIVFQHMSASMGQQFVVENRGGAAGSIGAEAVARAAPDGYTLMVHTTSHLANAHLYRKLPYDTLKDFTGVSLLSAQLGILVVHPSLPVKSVKQLLALARSRPDQILYSSAGNASFPHLATALLTQMTNTKLVHVPYKGAAPATTALVSGETQMLIVSASTALPHVRSNRLRALAVPSEARVKQFPDLPTVAESGVPGYEMNPWIAVFAPAGTPKAIVDRLNAEIRKTLEHPEISKRLYDTLLNPWYTTPEEMAKRVRVDYDKYEKLVKMTGVTID